MCRERARDEALKVNIENEERRRRRALSSGPMPKPGGLWYERENLLGTFRY